MCLKKSIAILFFLYSTIFVSAQNFIFLNSYPLKEEAKWAVDGLGNIIISEKDRLYKVTIDGKILFDQSQKSIGRIDEIGYVNSLKLFGFSEQQQLICFFDNSLSSLEKCIDLSDYDFMNVSLVASSIQSDKLWVFDQVNSTLQLVSLKGLLQSQLIKNLNGILNSEQLVQMIEWDNRLYLVDKGRGIYCLDNFGTLIKFYEQKEVTKIQVYNDYLICLTGDSFTFHSMNKETPPFSFALPIENVLDFY